MNDDDLPAVLPTLLPRLWRFALRLTQNQHDAEDLVQRACVRALERRNQLQPGTSTLSWLFSIVHSTWMNELRSRSIRSRGSMDWQDEEIESLADPGGHNPEVDLMHRQVFNAVEALPEAQRVVMVLVAIEGLSYREAADVLDVPIGTVMSRLSRARLTIGQQFGVQAPAAAQKGQKGESL
ncbi:RNA polymerase sigma factor [Caballeronia sp. GAFFF1]|jgi:RNA polymerase sigma-70 factor (ECF subfamily)|uniref:RNA polymerase sigma factor n=1 Tax=Caballeronia sp. GAFFF1 TaxID=2921779 RepID=UPI0020279544|nr:RNA polymerase sigma factor [Caballeronia sp. GAFFF1]